MSERKQWVAADANMIRGMFPEEPHNDQDTVDAAKWFGCELRDGMPEGPSYWALEPRCVVRKWFRYPNDPEWRCLGCCGSFDSAIRDAFFKMIRDLEEI